MPTSEVARTDTRRRTRSNGKRGVREDKKRKRWVATITIGWDSTVDADGNLRARQVRRSVTGRTEKEVLARFREAPQTLQTRLPELLGGSLSC